MECIFNVVAVLLLSAGPGDQFGVPASPHADKPCSVNVMINKPGKALRVGSYARQYG